MASQDKTNAVEAESSSSDINKAESQTELTINQQSANFSESTSSAINTDKSARRAMRVRKECHRSSHTDESDAAIDDRHHRESDENYDPSVDSSELLAGLVKMLLFDPILEEDGEFVCGVPTPNKEDSKATHANESEIPTIPTKKPAQMSGGTPKQLQAMRSDKTTNADKKPEIIRDEQDFDQLLAERRQPVPQPFNINQIPAKFEPELTTWLILLRRGFNLLLNGMGSKRVLLDSFYRIHLKTEKAVILQGFLPDLNVKDVLDAITQKLHLKLRSVNINKVYHAIQRKLRRYPDMHLYLLVHNLDGEPMRNKHMQMVVCRLATMPNVHFVATIDSTSAPSMWDKSLLNLFNFTWREVITIVPDATESSF